MLLRSNACLNRARLRKNQPSIGRGRDRGSIYPSTVIAMRQDRNASAAELSERGGTDRVTWTDQSGLLKEACSALCISR
jgi:hypothetical protein